MNAAVGKQAKLAPNIQMNFMKEISADVAKSEKHTEPTKTAKKAKPSKGSTESGAETSPKKAVAGSTCANKLDGSLTETSWRELLEDEFEKPYFKDMDTQLREVAKTKTTYPPRHLIFNAFNLTPINKIKVVILGQDPYHDDGQAMGLAFSVPAGVKVPPSLKNVYKELEKDIPGFKTPDHGNLEKWAKQGIFLLNTILTVEAHTPNSHAKLGWKTFTDAVLTTINDKCDKVVFILWGIPAQKKSKLLDREKHIIIEAAHPSPLSFNKFNDCKCFSKANKALKENGKTEINWSLS